MILPPHAEPRRARQRVALVCGVAIVLVAELVFAREYQHTVGWTALPILRLVHAALLVPLLVALLSGRLPLTPRVDVAIGLVTILPLLPIFWLGANDDLAFPGLSDPLVGYRIAIVGTALLMPGPLALVAATSGLFLLTESLHFELYRSLYGRQRIFAEPWITFFHVVVATLVIFLRARIHQLETEAVRIRAGEASARIVGDLRRALNDGALTPLQTIEASAFLQKQRHPDETDTADRILRAASRVRRLLGQLRTEEPEPAPEELSFDAHATLRRRLAAIPRLHKR